MNLYEIVPIFLPPPSHSLARSLARCFHSNAIFIRTNDDNNNNNNKDNNDNRIIIIITIIVRVIIAIDEGRTAKRGWTRATYQGQAVRRCLVETSVGSCGVQACQRCYLRYAGPNDVSCPHRPRNWQPPLLLATPDGRKSV